MNSKKFAEAMGEINNQYIDEAIHYKKSPTQNTVGRSGGLLLRAYV